MSDVISFIKQGWRNIWKQKYIWIFSLLPVLFEPVFRILQSDGRNLSDFLFTPIIYGLYGILLVISIIGVPYQAYKYSIHQSATIQETLNAVKKFWRRIISCSCLLILLILPFFYLFFFVSLKNSNPTQAANSVNFILTPFSVFNSLFSFFTFTIFEKDLGFRKSVKIAWDLFISHFGPMVILGILFFLIFRVSLSLSGIITGLIQSGFNNMFWNTFDIVNPSNNFGSNYLFLFLSSISQIIFTAFQSSVFVLAYQKYKE
jgi:hypothetical protein